MSIKANDSVALNSTSGAEQVTQSTLFIIGKNGLQNQLIKSYLEHQLPGPFEIEVHHEWHDDDDGGASVPDLVMLDCYGVAPIDLWRKISLGDGPHPAEQAIALFNVMPGGNNGFEHEAIERCVRGVFYANDAPELLSKGVEKILCGELWYSRKTTSQLLMDPQRYRPRTQALEAMLTAREKEVLVAIASGAANGEIAEEFSISLHTVKTHLYNIYKKIDVRNRLEATLWVARYLF